MKAYYFYADPIELRKLVVSRLKELGYETIIKAYSFPYFIINGFRDGEITTIGERAYCIGKGYEPGSLSALFNSDVFRYEKPDKPSDIMVHTSSYEAEYWRNRCVLAEKYIYISPLDPDIKAEQQKAWREYLEFINTKPAP